MTTWGELASYTWGQLGTWDNLLPPGDVTATDAVGLTDSTALTRTSSRSAADAVGLTDSVTAVLGKVAESADAVGITDSVTAVITDEHAGEWQYIYVPFGTEQFTIPDLTPGMPYEIEIRAMDAHGNASEWSAPVQQVGALDTSPPSTPAAPTVVSSKLALQVVSTLGKATGGTYNLESDLAYLEVHASSTSGFTPTTSTKLGTLPADKGLMLAGTPAVGTFKVDAVVAQYVRVIAVDKTGNRSPASATASATPGLLDSAYISELTASKLSAGTLGADVVVGARIKTANSGARVELNTNGLQAFNTSGTRTVNISAADGSAEFVGQLSSGPSGNRVVVAPSGAIDPTIRFYPDSGSNYAFISGVEDGSDAVSIGINTSVYTDGFDDYAERLYMFDGSARLELIDDAQQSAGGFAAITRDSASIGHQTGSTLHSRMRAESDGSLRFTGKLRGGAGSADSVLFGDVVNVGAGFSGLSISFGFTLANTVVVLYSILRSGSPNFDHALTAQTATGFTVSWSDTSAKYVNYLVFQV